jgi:hypothetical protein
MLDSRFSNVTLAQRGHTPKVTEPRTRGHVIAQNNSTGWPVMDHSAGRLNKSAIEAKQGYPMSSVIQVYAWKTLGLR